MISRKKGKWSLLCVVIFIITPYILLFSTKFLPTSYKFETTSLPVIPEEIKSTLKQGSYKFETTSLPVIPEEIKSTLKQGSYSSPRGNFSSFYVNIMPGPDEPQINQIFLHLMSQSRCALNNSETFIIDVGLNVGYFSLLTSTYDCSYVISLDPQIFCHQLYRLSRSTSAFANKWNAYLNAAWFRPVQLKIQRNVCDGGYSLNYRPQVVPKANETVIVQSVAVDSLPELQLYPSTEILLVKIDTEGAEIGVLLSCQKLIESNRVDNLIIELMNYQWSALMETDFNNSEEVGLKVLSDLQKKYEAILLADADFSDEIIAWSSSSLPKSNPLLGFSAVIPEGPKGFPVLLENRKRLTRGCNIWFRRKT